MTDHHLVLLAVGGLLLLGLLTDSLGRRTPLPRVTLLMIFGFGIGPAGLNLLPEAIIGSFDLLARIALVMVGFLLGGHFTTDSLRRHGRTILCISLCAALATAAVELMTLSLLSVPLGVTLVLAGIAPATAPAATADVVKESGGQNEFSETLLGVVALDDAWGLIIFSLCLALASVLLKDSGDGLLAAAVYEVGGAIGLGLLLGVPAASLTGRIEPGEPTLAEALGLVFVCGGLALWLDVSFLLAAMTLGAVIVNRADHHTRPFHAIENIEWPFMILFFVLAGASLEVDSLRHAGPVVVVYMGARVAGKVVGAWLGAKAGGSDPAMGRWVGLAMLPQAGVALGMALVAAERLPAIRDHVLPVVISSTVLFEIFGPVCTRYAVRKFAE